MLKRCFRVGLRLRLVTQQPITRFVSEYSSLLSSGQQLSMRDSDYRRCFGRSKCGIGDLCNPSSLGTALSLQKHTDKYLCSHVYASLHCSTYLTRNE